MLGGVGCAPSVYVVRNGEKLEYEEAAARALNEALDVYKTTKDLKKTVRALNRVCKDFPASSHCPEALIKQIVLLAEHKWWRWVENRASYFLEYYGESEQTPLVKYWLLQSYLHQGRMIKAREIALRIPLNRLPEDAAAHLKFLRAEIFFQSGHWDALFKECISILKKESPFKEGCQVLIDKALSIFPPDEVLRYQRILQSIPSLVNKLIDIADSYASQGDVSRALKILRRINVTGKPVLKKKLETRIRELEVASGNASGKILGMLLPLTGGMRSWGERVLKGFLFAYAGINLSSDVKVVVEDVGTTTVSAVNAFYSLMKEDKPSLIIGPVSAVGASALLRHSLVFRIPIVNITQVEGIAAASPYAFRLYLSPRAMVDALVRYSINQLHLQRFGIFFPRDGYGYFMMNIFWDTVVEHGGKVTMAKSYDPAHTDVLADVKLMVGTYYMDVFKKEAEEKGETLPPDFQPQPQVNFDALFVPDVASKSAFIARQLAYADVLGVQLLGTNLWNSQRLIELGENFVEGAIFADGFFADSPLPDVKNFVDDFYSEYGEKPDASIVYVYTFARSVLKFMDEGERDGETMRRYLLSTAFVGPAGTLSFDEKGELVHPVYIIAVEGGRFVGK